MNKTILLITILSIGCASVQTLSGGEKDQYPPIVLHVYPDSAALNSTDPTILFTFNEYIKTTKLSDLLIISPSQVASPTIAVKGKKLKITLNDSLLDNTTYTIQFNGSIIDNNEGNPLNSYTYLFSTGNYIDSLYYSGTVRDIQTNKPIADCNIHLYTNFNDSNILQGKPAYITRTDDAGNFRLGNLPLDSFQAVALLDNNKNLLLDEDDLVSLNTIIYPTESNDTLYLFPNENVSKHKPKLLKSSPGIYKIGNNRHLANSTLFLSINNTPIEFYLSPSKDTIIAYYTPLQDTSNIQIIIDSDTTLFQKITTISNLSYTPQLSVTKLIDHIHLSSKTPIDSIDQTKITPYLDSVTTTLTQLNSTPTDVHFSADPIPNRLVLLNGAITDVFGKKSVADTFILTPTHLTSTNLKLQINVTDTTNLILQLFRGDKLIKQKLTSNSQLFNFNHLLAGDYRCLIITDKNSNGIWDTGNTLISKSPEKIQITASFEIRENWDKELIINVE